MMSFLGLYFETSAAGRLPLTFYRPEFGPRPIPKQTPSKGNGRTITGPNESLGGGMRVGAGSHRHSFKPAVSARCPVPCPEGNRLLLAHSGQ